MLTFRGWEVVLFLASMGGIIALPLPKGVQRLRPLVWSALSLFWLALFGWLHAFEFMFVLIGCVLIFLARLFP